MNIDNIRNCNCNNQDNQNDFEYDVSGNQRQEMLEKIMSLEFSINDLALYLDTHPDDKKALCLHNRYCKECQELKDKYQKVYGPLTINYPCNKWRWIEEPWPWERGND